MLSPGSHNIHCPQHQRHLCTSKRIVQDRFQAGRAFDELAIEVRFDGDGIVVADLHGWLGPL